jgi:hypothetical protein
MEVIGLKVYVLFYGFGIIHKSGDKDELVSLRKTYSKAERKSMFVAERDADSLQHWKITRGI